MIVIEFVRENDTIVFADHVKGEEFVSMLPKRDIREGNIIIKRI